MKGGAQIMNRNKFYKELMEEYTFDSAKIRRFAKRSSYKGARVSVKRWWHIPSTVAVAAASLVLGLFSFFYSPNQGTPVVNPEPPVTDSSGQIVTLPPQHHIVQLDYFSNATLYLSFNNSMTFREIENTLETIDDTGNIVIEVVYIRGEGADFIPITHFDEIRNEETATIVGATVSAPGRLKIEIERQQEVELVIVVTADIAEETFIPSPSAIDAIENAQAPVIMNEPAAEKEDDLTGEAGALEKFVSLNVAGIIEAHFINDYHFVAMTANSVMLYEIIADEEILEINQISEFMLHNHRTRFSTTRNSMLISGCREDSRRTVLLIADAQTAALEEIDISHLTEDSGELIFAFYDDVNERIIMRVRNANHNLIYILNRDTHEVQTVFNSEKGAAILAVSTGTVFYSVTGAESTTVYRYDISADARTAIDSLVFTDSVSFERNSDLSAFIINTNGAAQVFTADTETLTEGVAVENGLIFHKNSRRFMTDGTNFFTVPEEKPDSLELFAGQATTSRRDISELFSMFEITEKSLRILIKA
jgi:sulfur transfer complex TusBCD TusB component (DsrH family)